MLAVSRTVGLARRTWSSAWSPRISTRTCRSRWSRPRTAWCRLRTRRAGVTRARPPKANRHSRPEWEMWPLETRKPTDGCRSMWPPPIRRTRPFATWRQQAASVCKLLCRPRSRTAGRVRRTWSCACTPKALTRTWWSRWSRPTTAWCRSPTKREPAVRASPMKAGRHSGRDWEMWPLPRLVLPPPRQEPPPLPTRRSPRPATLPKVSPPPMPARRLPTPPVLPTTFSKSRAR